MSAFANTPELKIDRSDSKNPATTCRGITSSGRPCRNAIRNVASQQAPITKRTKLRVDDPADETLYCWQHKDQASISAHSSPGPRTGHTPILEERTSIDTLAERLGLIDIEDGPQKRPKPQRHNAGGVATHPRPKKKRQKQSSLWCCFALCSDSSYVDPPPRPKPTPIQGHISASMPAGLQGNRKEKQDYGGTPNRRSDYEDPFVQSGGRRPKPTTPEKSSKPGSSRPTPSPAGTPSRPPRTSKLSPSPNAARPSSRRPSDVKTLEFLRLVEDVPPDTAALLLAELAKPISENDEPGYIYIFRLEPERLASTPSADASTPLRTPNDLLAPGGSRGGKQVVASQSQGTYLLKVGRANNVQRRLNEWKRQCDHEISLVRYYPYVSSREPDATPRKMPHSHKVERLIHIQLTGLNMRVTDREKCKNCGREHREWFEVKADRDSVADFDRIVRKWSDWNEAEGHKLT
ncbi:Meiotically up-regulated gene 113 domain containing protein [Rhypophila decipiens]